MKTKHCPNCETRILHAREVSNLTDNEQGLIIKEIKAGWRCGIIKSDSPLKRKVWNILITEIND